MAAVVRWNNTEGKVKVERRQMGGGKLRVNLGNKCKRSQLPQLSGRPKMLALGWMVLLIEEVEE